MYKNELLLVVVLSPGLLPAQDLPDAPSAHSYWDRTNKILLISHVGLETADFIATHHNLSVGGKELNPIAKPLVNLGTGGQVAYFASQTAGVLVISCLLYRRGHHRLERILIMGANVSSAHGVIYSFSHR